MERCQAITASGNQCKLNAIEGTLFCRVHASKAAEEVQIPPAPPVADKPKETGAVDYKAKREAEKKAARAKYNLKPRLGGEVPVIIDKTKKRRIRYIGRGTYIIASLNMQLGPKDYGKEINVDYAFWQRMHEDAEAMKCFEEV